MNIKARKFKGTFLTMTRSYVQFHGEDETVAISFHLLSPQFSIRRFNPAHQREN